MLPAEQWVSILPVSPPHHKAPTLFCRINCEILCGRLCFAIDSCLTVSNFLLLCAGCVLTSEWFIWDSITKVLITARYWSPPIANLKSYLPIDDPPHTATATKEGGKSSTLSSTRIGPLLRLHNMLEEWFVLGDAFSLIQVISYRLNESRSGRSQSDRGKEGKSKQASERKKISVHRILT